MKQFKLPLLVNDEFKVNVNTQMKRGIVSSSTIICDGLSPRKIMDIEMCAVSPYISLSYVVNCACKVLSKGTGELLKFEPCFMNQKWHKNRNKDTLKKFLTAMLTQNGIIRIDNTITRVCGEVCIDIIIQR